jgi:hypothetical protein
MLLERSLAVPKKEDNARLAAQEDKELKRLLGDDDEVVSSAAEKERDKAQREIIETLHKLIGGFLSTQDEVVKQSNENRSGLQDEIDVLHKILLSNGQNGQKPIRECEIDALARLRQIQADQTANRVSLMDSAAKMISALKYMLKDNGGKKSRGDGDLRAMLGDSAAEDV